MEDAEIRDAVLKKYREVARSPEGRFNYPTGKAGLLAQGYDLSVAEGVPDEVLLFFTGVGNPFSLAAIERGERVLDIGCGAGFDLIYAARLTGPGGFALGVDITLEMVKRAGANLKLASTANAATVTAKAEELPLADGSFDAVVSNGVLNLSPYKDRCLKEAHRVLREGGRLMLADMVLKEGVAKPESGGPAAWSE